MRQLLVVLILSALVTSCNSPITEEGVTGTWKVADLEFNTPELSPMLLEATKESATRTTYRFLANSTFVVSDDFGERTGQWDLGKNGVITLTNNDGTPPERYTVESLDSRKLVLSQSLEDLGSMTYSLSRVE